MSTAAIERDRTPAMQDALIVVHDCLARLQLELQRSTGVVHHLGKRDERSVVLTDKRRLDIEGSHRSFVKPDAADFVISVEADDRRMRNEMHVLALVNRIGPMPNERHRGFAQQIERIRVVLSKFLGDSEAIYQQ